jgi:uncharacterized protein with HEPN domain
VKSDLPYLGHIQDSISAIESYVKGGRDAFMSQRLIQDAVIRNFEVIGEAASKLSPPARRHGDAIWKKVISSEIASFMGIGVSICCWCGM